MKSEFYLRLHTLTICLALFGTVAFAQQNSGQQPIADASKAAKEQLPEKPAAKMGNIKGRVLGDDGQPLASIPVFAAPIGRGAAAGRRQGPAAAPAQTTTDDDGNFEFVNLFPASYSISATVPGFIAPPAEEESGAGIYHLGDAANITLIKGGVITGKVVNATGEPLTGISINAIRIGNVNGEADDQSQAQPPGGPQGFGRNWRTDDRGIYRIYGLIPGSYIVQACGQTGGRGGGVGPNFPSPFSEDAPTYYPSSARDAAVPVVVRVSDEASGIDIRYRGEKGRTVSGKILAKAGEINTNRVPVQISLMLAGTDAIVATTVQMGGGANAGFAFYGIPDGEYEIAARRAAFGPESDAVAIPRRVPVHGLDINGVQLTLAPLALLSGKVVIEKKAGAAACPSPRKSFVEEILLTAQHDEPQSRQDAAISRIAPRRPSAPSAAGDFTLRNLEAGRWRVGVQLPDENWYVRAMTPDGRPPAAARKPVSTAASPPINLARNGVMFKLGEKLTGVTITIAESAAGIAGKLTSDQNIKLPGIVRVHLIPAEKEAADEVLRYSQTTASSDGSFRFKNLAPGRYYLLAKTTKSNELQEQRPLAWDMAQRAALRKEAETAPTVVELQPCQRVNDYKLNLGVKMASQ